MGANREQLRWADRRACRPNLDGRLEPRALLSVGNVWIAGTSPSSHGAPGSPASPALGAKQTAFTGGTLHTLQASTPPLASVFIHPPKVLVERSGKGVRILDGQGGAFDVVLTNGPGTIKAQPTPEGRFNLTATGTNSQTVLSINPVRPTPQRRQAHTFNPDYGIGREILGVQNITVTTGNIGSILGFRTADLFGTIDLSNGSPDSPVDRIALNRLHEGATIRTAGDLNTLDIFGAATLSGANTGIFVGRDLNLINVGGDLTITNGAVIKAARYIGATPQPAKGTGTGSNVSTSLPVISGLIKGALTIVAPSSLTATAIINPISVLGPVSPIPPTPLISPPTTPTGFASVVSGPIITRPAVVARSPTPGATNVPRTTNVTATFNGAMDPATITTGTFTLIDPLGMVVPVTVIYDITSKTATLTLQPTFILNPTTQYTAIIVGGPNGVKDTLGNTMAATDTWSFTTGTV